MTARARGGVAVATPCPVLMGHTLFGPVWRPGRTSHDQRWLWREESIYIGARGAGGSRECRKTEVPVGTSQKPVIVSMPSQKANKYGTAAEHHVIKRRNLEPARCYWHDARFQNGTPVEIKACDVDSTGYFQIYEEAHKKLRDAGGWYAFAPYRRSGGSTRIVDVRMRRCSKMPLMRWSGTGGHRDSRKAKVPVSAVL